MKKRFLVLIEDDFEVMGNGLGNVAELQYLPGLALMNIAKKHDVKLTFMVDVANQLELTKHISARHIRIQKELWDETILLMIERGLDVQLHLHPQWVGADYKGGHFHVAEDWNIGRYGAEAQELLISAAVDYLTSLIQPTFPDYNVCAFKAGSWGLQPSESLFSSLKSYGISVVMGVRDGMRMHGTGVDYRGMEEKYLPYHPEFKDVRRKSADDNGILILPLQPYDPDLLTFSILVVDRIRDKLRQSSSIRYMYDNPIPSALRALSPETGKSTLRASFRPYSTHLKIGNQPFSYLKRSFDAVINRLRRLDAERIPVVIESHTKQFAGYYEHIDRFIGYIREDYADEAEFGDLSGFVKEVAATGRHVSSNAN